MTASTGKIEILPWNGHLATGIQEIDEQNQKLVALVNHLADDLAHAARPDNLGLLFNELAEYSASHFANEERLWDSVLPGDAWTTEHRKAHGDFAVELNRLKNALTTPSKSAVENLLSFLIHWIASHIFDSDRQMVAMMKAIRSGLSPDEARQQVRKQTGTATRVLIDNLLAMYNALVSRNLQLMRERVMAESQAGLLLQRNQLLVQSTPEGISILDENGRVIDANDAFCHHLGYTREEVLQLTLSDFEVRMSSGEISARLGTLHGGHTRFEGRHRRKDGTLVDVESVISEVEVEGARCFFSLSRDITEQKRNQESIRSLAFHDTLTQLPNRRLLLDRLEQAIAASKRHARHCALLFLDLDKFKPLNDEYGHVMGDQLLVQLAGRLGNCMRDMDTVARFGGDEFIVLLPELSPDLDESKAQARLVAEKIAAVLAEPYHLILQPFSAPGDRKTIEYSCTTSIGVVLFINDHMSADDIIRHADMAMYRAKESGRNSIRFHGHGT